MDFGISDSRHHSCMNCIALETDIILYRHQMEHELFIEKRLHTLIMGYGQATSVHDCVYVHMCIYMYTLRLRSHHQEVVPPDPHSVFCNTSTCGSRKLPEYFIFANIANLLIAIVTAAMNSLN